MTTKTYAQMTSAELRRERDTLAMLYDDHYRAVGDDEDPMYSQADLDYWDRRIGELDAECQARERCPICGHSDLRVVGGGDTPALFECQRCAETFALGEVAYDDSGVL